MGRDFIPFMISTPELPHVNFSYAAWAFCSHRKLHYLQPTKIILFCFLNGYPMTADPLSLPEKSPDRNVLEVSP